MLTTFDPTEGPSEEQMAAEAAALEQGEKIARMQEEDRARQYSQVEVENENAALIGGKFKSQEDLLKAYEALQAKLGKPAEERGEEADEADAPEGEGEDEDGAEKAPEEGLSEPVRQAYELINEFSQSWDENSGLTADKVEQLASIDSRALVEAYLRYQQGVQAQARAQVMQAQEMQALMESVGGQAAYQEMTAWAAENMDQADIDQFNAVTATGNGPAIRFAVEALQARYRGAVGFEGKMVRGKKGAAPAGPQPIRSHAELARYINDPKWSSDPAFRADVEARLAVSRDLL